jgi:Rps23 Pro-64 3,4-dihydroxylase Tpa1-like proline 4-hydroxylase
MSYSQSQLKSIAEVCAQRIISAIKGQQFYDQPYRHLVLDDFLPETLANQCLHNFPAVTDAFWEHANDADIEIKYRTTWKSEFDIPDGIVEAIRILNSAPVLKAFSERIGIPKLIPDPYFSGGGLNVTKPGGLLDVHVDGNYHDATGLNRRLNALIYLNPDWQSGWGGEFGLYDATGKICIKKIPPLFNRLIVFDSHDYSFHGLPNPLNFPPGQDRKSIILYYYTHEARPLSQVAIKAPHSALWVKRDLHDKRGNKTRDFT